MRAVRRRRTRFFQSGMFDSHDAANDGHKVFPALLLGAEHHARNRHFLEKLPLGPVERDGVLICHGAPHDEDEYVFHEGHAREIFEEMRWHKIGGSSLRHLSMGMSHDFELAIAEGATLVRVGTLLFGGKVEDHEEHEE